MTCTRRSSTSSRAGRRSARELDSVIEFGLKQSTLQVVYGFYSRHKSFLKIPVRSHHNGAPNTGGVEKHFDQCICYIPETYNLGTFTIER